MEIFFHICNFLKKILSGTEFENHVYVCGGAVRDLIMKRPIKDIDICVDIENGGIKLSKWLYDNNHLAHIPVTYPTYGTSMFSLSVYPEIEIEAVQTRKEQYKDKSSRNPEVTFGTLKEDCNRRDLTINSLYYDIFHQKYIDITGYGKRDIKAKKIRCIGEISNPENINYEIDRIYEDDPLRILRAIRMCAVFGFDISDLTYDGLKRNVDRLQIISKERINSELNKILLSGNPVHALKIIKDIGAFKYIIPEIEGTYELFQNAHHNATVWWHTLETVQLLKGCGELDVMMSGLLHDIGKIRTLSYDDNGKTHFYEHEIYSEKLCDAILKRLKYSNSFIKTVKILVKNHMRTKQWGKKIKDSSVRKLEYELGETNFYKLMKLIHADNNAHGENRRLSEQVYEILENVEKHKQNGTDMFSYKLPVCGDDVMNILKIPSGKEVSKCLQWCMKFAYANPKITRKEMYHNIEKQYSR